MRATKYLLFAGLGVAALLLLTSDKAVELREELEENAKENAKKWRQKLAWMGNDTSDKLADLRSLLASEIDGLSDDARQRIENIIDGTTKTAGKIKKNLNSQLS
jgi:F0F1-type ATP synthase membrane subunit b/b'